jgi:hypothetical protein
MGTISIRIVTDPDSRPFGDGSMLDTCINPQFNGVFPDDPALGIVSERKANDRIIAANSPAIRNPRSGEDNKR